MRLIDADKLPMCKFVTAGTSEPYAKGWNDAIDAIVDNEPTVERPHGKWIYHKDWYRYEECPWECSECGTCSDDNMNFCGECGADMREGDNDN